MKGQFSVKLPTKAYLKKYIEILYGSPVSFDTSSYLGKIIAVVLDKNVFPERSRKVIHKTFDVYDKELTIFLPIRWLEKYYYGTDVNAKKVVYINKLIEDKFEEELFMYCQALDLLGIERKDALLEFCAKYELEIDEDITFECIKKMEYRIRMKYSTKSVSYSSPLVHNALQGTLF